MKVAIRYPVICEDRTIKVPLTQGYTAIIDWEDAWVLRRRWAARPQGNTVYAAAGTLFLHRLILGLEPKSGFYADHIDGNGLDCRRSNLRAVNCAENSRNIKLHMRNKSGHAGVCYNKVNKCWQASLNRKWLGAYKTLEGAVAARLDAEKAEWGVQPRREYAFEEFQKLNIEKFETSRILRGDSNSTRDNKNRKNSKTRN